MKRQLRGVWMVPIRAMQQLMHCTHAVQHVLMQQSRFFFFELGWDATREGTLHLDTPVLHVCTDRIMQHQSRHHTAFKQTNKHSLPSATSHHHVPAAPPPFMPHHTDTHTRVCAALAYRGCALLEATVLRREFLRCRDHCVGLLRPVRKALHIRQPDGGYQGSEQPGLPCRRARWAGHSVQDVQRERSDAGALFSLFVCLFGCLFVCISGNAHVFCVCLFAVDDCERDRAFVSALATHALQ
jgi:hypothetical protein